MTSISSIGATAPTQPTRAVAPIDREREADNAGDSAATGFSERGPAARVTLSPQAQALLNGQKG